jgi:hypothetical protein
VCMTGGPRPSYTRRAGESSGERFLAAGDDFGEPEGTGVLTSTVHIYWCSYLTLLPWLGAVAAVMAATAAGLPVPAS